MTIVLPSSKFQTSLASALETYRRLYLQEALSETVAGLSLPLLNAELDGVAPPADLLRLATDGIRGELLFATPSVLTANPRLLAYYRLLLGFSQKEFYQKAKLGRFENMEWKGLLIEKLKPQIGPLCMAFADRASELLNGLGVSRLTVGFFDDLTLLTLGPQLRGSHNTKIGQLANRAVFELIRSIVAPSIQSFTDTRIELLNASSRKVMIAFSSDPDISVRETLSARTIKNVVAIEIKGGTDGSNIWNRLGEAEKSHQTAKQRDFVEFWTIHNVPNFDLAKAREKSPTSHRFYSLPHLLTPTSEDFADFRDRLAALVGIASESS